MRPSLRQVLFRSVGLDLNFAGGVFSLNNTRTDTPAAIPGWSFSRTDTNGTATALDLAGNVIQFATGVPRITNRGILVEEARTNLNPYLATLSNWQSNTATITSAPGTYLGLFADAKTVASQGGTFNRIETIPLSVVSGTTYALTFWYAAGTSGQVRLNAAVGANSSHYSGPVANPSTIASVAGTVSGLSIKLSGSVYTATFLWTPNASGNANIGIGPSSTTVGQNIIAIAAQIELGAFATSPIITTGAAGTRGADAASIVLPSNVSSYTATYNNGTTATGAVTPGATFDLIAARPWLNGYLQRFRVT